MSSTISPFNRTEEDSIRAYWKENKIVEKVHAKESSASAKGKFYFMDGPPYATGHIHMGTGLNKIMKDCAIRSQRMQGKKIFARPGFDTHGLPIENKVEKKLGFNTKKDIEEYGVENFVKECRKFATEFVDTMGVEFDNLADWMDYSNPYLTLSNEYIEAIWFAFKKADEKNLLYLGKYPVHVCPHCATAVAYNEIEYTKIGETSIFVKLKVNDSGKNKLFKQSSSPENTFLLVWTTTPWTLPANTGVMVHPKYEYAFVKLGSGEVWIIAKEKVNDVMSKAESSFTIEKVVTGAELEGMTYDALFPNVIKDNKVKEKGFRVILSDRYVNLEDGSGLVHTAPGHGKEDFDAGTKAGLPVISPVNLDGTFTSDVDGFSGKAARGSNEEIITLLESKNLLPLKMKYAHDYPMCWRCNSPLLMISVPQWFIKVSEIRSQMLSSNETVNWVPTWMKDRMKNWLENLSDWPVSRARYWGTPLPIWLCDCGEKKVIGSIRELKKESGLKEDIELHKPYIDAVTIPCKCGKEMHRVSEVLDVWFDSGVSSWANLGYPANDKLFREFWPADLNIEMTEQVRGWWNSQAILSTICFDKFPFKSISVHGMVLDLGKKKMSKSKGGVAPEDVIAEYNRDYLRTYLLLQSKGTDFKFDEKGVGDLNNFFNTLTNSLNYARLYMKIDLGKKPATKKLKGEDAWIMSKLEKLSLDALSAYNGYEFSSAVNAIMDFVDKDFSRTYLQLIRTRIGTDSQTEIDEVVSYTINVLLRLFAPIAPHSCEYYFKNFNGEKISESVHLLDFVEVKDYRNEELEGEFELVNFAAQAALALRSEQKLRVRWLLEELVVESEQKLSSMSSALAKMVNVKKVTSLASGKSVGEGFVMKDFGKGKVYLKIVASQELKENWEFSELARLIQDGRKKAGLNPGQKVTLELSTDDLEFIAKHKEKLEEKTSTNLKVVSGIKMEKLVERSFGFEIKQ
ncbi:MAG: isoleucine--tRNA ligase [archaeon]